MAVVIIGKIRTISISKIKKRIVKRKNRSENGMRADFLGSNPHSKGDDFSRSCIVFILIKEDKIKIAAAISMEIEKKEVVKIIDIGE